MVSGTSQAKNPREVYDAIRPLAAHIMRDLQLNDQLSKYGTTELFAAVIDAFRDVLNYEMMTH